MERVSDLYPFILLEAIRRLFVIMRYIWLSALSALSAAPLCLIATPLSPHWDDICVKHALNAIPTGWMTLGHPSAGITIDLHLALEPRHPNALIDALYEVSDPKNPKHVPSMTLLCAYVLILVADMAHTCLGNR